MLIGALGTVVVVTGIVVGTGTVVVVVVEGSSVTTVVAVPLGCGGCSNAVEHPPAISPIATNAVNSRFIRYSFFRLVVRCELLDSRYRFLLSFFGGVHSQRLFRK